MSIFLKRFQQEIDGCVLTILDKAALDDGVIGDVVWSNAFLEHQTVHFEGLVDSEGLETRLDHAGIDKNTCFYACSFHFFKDVQGLVDVSHLLVDFCKDGVGYITCFDFEFFHVFVAF